MYRVHSPDRLRRGIASLEYVMVLPFLLVIVWVLFLLGRADVAKVGAATAARRLAGQQRSSANPGVTFQLLTQPQDSEVGPPARIAFPLDPVLRGQTRQAQSDNPVVGNTWNDPAISFASLDNDCLPHYDVLSQVARGMTQSGQNLPLPPQTSATMNPRAFAGMEAEAGKASDLLEKVTGALDAAGHALDALNQAKQLAQTVQNVAQVAIAAANKKKKGGGVWNEIAGAVEGAVGDFLGGLGAGINDLLQKVGGLTGPGGLLSKAFGSYGILLQQATAALDFVNFTLITIDNLSQAAQGRPGGQTATDPGFPPLGR